MIKNCVAFEMKELLKYIQSQIGQETFVKLIGLDKRVIEEDFHTNQLRELQNAVDFVRFEVEKVKQDFNTLDEEKKIQDAIA